MIRKEELKNIFLKKIPFIDVRSNFEYMNGSVRHAVNIPILNDEERVLVGKCYRKEGAEEALSLGYRLVDGETRKKRVQCWSDFIGKNEDCVIFCARGGHRSQITKKWLNEIGVNARIVDGGFKVIRNYLLRSFTENCEKVNFLVLAGPTGSGKTILLNRFNDIIDLEKRANHRGSSFGSHISGQPSQIDFENNLSIDLIRILDRKNNMIMIEDESRLIGKIHLPDILTKKMSGSKIVILETPMDERVDSILGEYVAEALNSYNDREEGLRALSDSFLFNLKRISKKLGGVRFKEIENDMESAFNIHRDNDDMEPHRIWIEKLLTYYYDPMYQYSLNKRSEQVIFKGDFECILSWIKSESILVS